MRAAVNFEKKLDSNICARIVRNMIWMNKSFHNQFIRITPKAAKNEKRRLNFWLLCLLHMQKNFDLNCLANLRENQYVAEPIIRD